ncbi:neutrophil cytosol factor 1 [Polypterus senegalus]|uniref:neutrophil cytosol factor 1 n=1 Tax=Polypterus senegalus TaxID=55291 RepID=UPI00196277D1|nr:neutrophil cytosol factor 1 [Polypterus senegalus]
MGDSVVLHVELLGFERRFFPSQHYVYMFLVKWSDLSEKLIYRTFTEIYSFHKNLKEMFPIEAGEIDNKDRIIPSLPAPKWFDNQKTTETRQGTLADYCRTLLNLPIKISHCHLVLDFFRVRQHDENPPAPHPFKRNETFLMGKEQTRTDKSEITGPIILQTYRLIAEYKKSSKHELSMKAGDLVEVVEKSTSGWWFCQTESHRGWLPATYLEPLEGPDESEDQEPNYEGELYQTTKPYKAEQEDEISLEQDVTIEVIHKLLDGWWVVRKGEQTGYYPSMLLQKTGEKRTDYPVKTLNEGAKPPPRRSTIRNAQSIHQKGRQRISQETYRRNSRRYLQQRGPHANRNRGVQSGQFNQQNKLTSVLEILNNTENTDHKKTDQPNEQKALPVIPPRPSKEVILERCTETTRKKVSIRNSS